MVEDADKKDDEKLDFDSTGQALGYISVDQARVLALRHANGKRGIYGRYANRQLGWEVLEAEETEDYYEIKLTYRPARGFRGYPGVEEFYIDKAGPIELHRILGEPRPHRRIGIVLRLWSYWPPPEPQSAAYSHSGRSAPTMHRYR